MNSGIDNYRKQIESINKKAKSEETEDALKSIVSKTKRNWWHIQMEASATSNNDEKQKIFEKGIKEFPESDELLVFYAFFLTDDLKNYEEADKYFKKAIELKPDDVDNLALYATFLSEKCRNPEEADKYYKKAMELQPDNSYVLGAYAAFLSENRKNDDVAEKYFKKAIELEPSDCNNLGNYARLLLWQEKVGKAKEYIDKAFSLNPDNQSLLAELWFYRYAHYSEYYELGKQKLEELIKAGAKSQGWDLIPNIEIAKKVGHPDIETLEKFAKQIAEP